MKALHMVTFILLVVGGLNWGLTAFDWNIVAKLLGAGSMAERVVYVLVGVAAIVEVATHKNTCKECVSAPSTM